MKTINFKHYTCELKTGVYGNGRVALQLIENGLPVATASTNLVNEEIQLDEVAIKDYGENSGMLKALIDAGVVGEPIRIVEGTHVSFPICKLLIDIK